MQIARSAHLLKIVARWQLEFYTILMDIAV